MIILYTSSAGSIRYIRVLFVYGKKKHSLFPINFEQQPDKLSMATSWLKQAMVLYMPAATTAAKPLQYWFFVL